MENVKLVGEVEVQLREIGPDGTIGPVVQSWKQENLVTDKGMRYVIQDGRFFGPWIGLSSDTTPPSRQEPHLGTKQRYGAASGSAGQGYVPSGVTSPNWFEASGPNPMYCQFQNRWDAPTSTPRTINAIFLTSAALAENATGGYTPGQRYQLTTPANNAFMSAHVLLNTTLTQSTTQVLDVFYRLKWVIPASKRGVGTSAIRKLARLSCNVGTEPAPSSDYWCWKSNIGIGGTTFDLFQNAGANWNNAFSSGIGAALGPTIVLNTSRYQRKASWSLSTSQGIGQIIGSQLVGAGSNPNLYCWESIRSTTDSAIQPIFNHSVGSSTPYQDVNWLASGTGTLTAGGTWTNPDWPKMFKITITGSGDVGTATYQFSARRMLGTDGPSGISQNAPGYGWCPWFCSSDYTSSTLSPLFSSGPTTVHNLMPLDTSVVAAGYSVPYGNTAMVTYNATGITYASLISVIVKNYDATTTPALPVTAVAQVEVGIDGLIWVACNNTGLYKVDPVGNTVTHVTITGVTNQFCFGVDIGRSGSIWAVMDGGLCHSTDNGSTWTVYNATSSPAFIQAGVTDGNWNSVTYLRADPTNVNDQLALVRSQTTGVSQTMAIVWFALNGGTPAVTALICGATNQNVAQAFGVFRNTPQNFNVSDTNGFWAGVAGAFLGGNYPVYLFKFTFGATSIVTSTTVDNTVSLYSYGNTPLQFWRIYFAQTSSGNDAVFLCVALNGYPTMILCPAGGVAATSITPFVPNTPVQGTAAMFQAWPMYLGKGIWTFIHDYGFNPQSTATGQHIQIVAELTHDNTTAGGPLAYIGEDTYGWNGSTWVLNNAGSKTVHATQDALIEGITLSFTNGSPSPSFVSTDYYTFGVCNGVLKDNATTVSGTFNLLYTGAVQSSDIDGTGIVGNLPVFSANTAVTWANAPGAGFTANAVSTTLTVANTAAYGFNLMSNELLTGDFTVSWAGNGSNWPNVYNAGLMGIGDQFGNPMFGIYTDVTTTNANQGTAGYTGTGYASWVTDNAFASTLTADGVARNTVTSFAMTKTGNNLQFYINGVLKTTITNAFVDANIQYRVVHYWPQNTTGRYPTPLITSNTQYVGAIIGNAVNQTGKYDSNFYLFNDDTSKMSFALNGIPVTSILTDGNMNPGANVVAVNSSMRAIICNSSAVGQTLTGTYTYLKLPNT